jgi:phosphonatase-like hydrolase
MIVKLVVFDMAGTTVKDKNYVGIAFQLAMRSYGYEVAIEQINPIMGYEKPLAIRMMLERLQVENITSEMVEQIHLAFVNLMKEFYLETDQLTALPHVEETFERLREMGVKVALNTGFSRDIAEIIIDRLGWEDKVDLLVASDEVQKGRPYPDMINKIMQQLGVESAGSVVKIGDTEVDVNEGLNAGCKYVIGVTTGAFTREELLKYEPMHIIDDIAEIFEIIFAGDQSIVEQY